MTPTPPEGFAWPANWAPIPAGDTWLGYPRIMAETFGGEPPSDSLADELQREVSPAHQLFQVPCSPIARNGGDPNEFLFFTAHPEMPLAFVHLTWTKETGAKFPWVKGYKSWEELQLAWAEPSSET